MRIDMRRGLWGCMTVLGLLLAGACVPAQPPQARTGVPVDLGAQVQTGQRDLDRGYRALDAGDVAVARDAFTAAMRTSPNDARAALGLAETYLARGETATAARLLEAAARSAKGGQSARFSQGLGAVALQQGRTAQALGHFRAAVAQEPGLWRSWIGLGRAQILSGDRVSARVSFVRAERLAEDRPIALNDIGMSFLAENLATEAVPYFERALALDPDFRIARANLRIARAMSGAYDVAIAGATPAELADALNNAGYVAVLKGDYEVAQKFLRRALDLSPEFHAAASANLDLLEQASTPGIAQRVAAGPEPAAPARQQSARLARRPFVVPSKTPPAAPLATPPRETAIRTAEADGFHWIR